MAVSGKGQGGLMTGSDRAQADATTSPDFLLATIGK